ncbi:MAG: HD domain-containing protein [Candidatus Woesearchaeota archaeon]
MNSKEKKIISEIHILVQKASIGFSEDDVFSNHILSVRDYAIRLARKYDADMFVVVTAAYLHDIYHLQTHNHEIHEVEGAKFADKYLRKFDIEEERIRLICNCILNHRGSKKRKRVSIEEKIIACADAMDHIVRWKHMFYRISQRKSYEESIDWLRNKLERGWKKLELPEAKTLVKKEYLIAKSALEQ